MRCCVPSCPNSRKRLSVPSFGIPKSDIRDRWLEVLKIDPQLIKKSTRVCMLHFTEDDVYHYSSMTKLKPKRVPSQKLGNEPHVEDNEHIEDNIVNNENIDLTNSITRQTAPLKKRNHFVVIASQFYVENFIDNDKEIMFYTGVQSYKLLTIIFKYVFKSEKGSSMGAVHQTGDRLRRKHKLTPLNEMFLTLMKLRHNYEYRVLGRMFLISTSAVGRIFITWVNLLYSKLTDIDIFPHRDEILSHAPQNYVEKYPNVLGSIDCTEFFIQKPSSLVRQSQCYSNYKGRNTMKSLIMSNPNGGIIFVSTLYSGSISDKQLVKESGFLKLLKNKKDNKEINDGDIILADKGFEISDLLENIGMEINIPTFKVNGMQFREQDVQSMRKISHERIHVERVIRRIKTFKILSHTIPISLLSCINQIYIVCALLTNFMGPIRQ